MDLFSAFVLGVVEGITEFLPVSSTGHLILTSKLLQLPQDEFLKSFEVAIQLGAILSVIFLYRGVLARDGEALKRIFIAFLPTAVAGLIFYRFIKESLLDDHQLVTWALMLGGIFLIVFERWYKGKKVAVEAIGQMSYKQAALIGIFQALSIVPGVSRAAATIIGGLILGVNRTTIVEFSFLLAVPTMAGATALDLTHSAGQFSRDEFGLLTVGFVTSFAVALLSIKFLLHFIKNHNFIPFGIYRIIVALVFWWVGASL
ncbi:MAG TPA: undecaprenyl-diphosphate phosphatase [Candidatus Omnitrophota bacterium]|nr:undecaprenyl-diphosphate phosphatase [Candidatus Omnitrophota bacterium]